MTHNLTAANATLHRNFATLLHTMLLQFPSSIVKRSMCRNITSQFSAYKTRGASLQESLYQQINRKQIKNLCTPKWNPNHAYYWRFVPNEISWTVNLFMYIYVWNNKSCVNGYIWLKIANEGDTRYMLIGYVQDIQTFKVLLKQDIYPNGRVFIYLEDFYPACSPRSSMRLTAE